MSFLKIVDPAKREQTVKKFLAIKKKNIRANELAEKTGKIELQTDLSELFKPVTETQKDTTREITETQKDTQRAITSGLRPIKKGLKPIKGLKGIKKAIEQLPQRLPQQLPQQIDYPLSTAPPSYRSTSPTLTELPEAPSTSGEEIEKIAFINPDNIFGPRMTQDGIYMGNKPFKIQKDDILIGKKNKFKLTKGLSNLIFSKNFDPDSHNASDYTTYVNILKLTNTMHLNNDPNNPNFKFQAFEDPILKKKALVINEDIWEGPSKTKYYKEKTGSGVKKVVIPSDPNALLEKLDLLMASKAAGNTGVRNELVSVCDELKRQGIFDSKYYKKIMSLL